MARAQTEKPKRERITDRKKGESTGKQIARIPIRLATLPLWVLDRGLYHGMIVVDEKKLVPRAHHALIKLAKLGLAPQIGGAGDGAGFGGGMAWTPYKGPVTPTLAVSASINGYQDHGVALDFSGIFGEQVDVITEVRFRSSPEEDFFGIGPNSHERNRTSYHLEQTAARLHVKVPVAGALTSDASVELSNNNIFGGKDTRFPSTEDLFTGAEVPGLDEGSELVTGDVALTLDLRDHPGDATSGGVIRVFAGVGEDVVGSAFNYWHYGGEAQSFVPLLGRGSRFGPRSVLAVRVRGDFHQPRSGGTVPFFKMPHIGGSSSVRGFREFRFFDDDIVVANIEYRWPIMSLKTMPLLEALLFLDEGQVFDRSDDFDFDSFRESYGGGLRVVFKHSIVFRIEVGRSTEATRVFTKFKAMF
jgi:hypothetical protein